MNPGLFDTPHDATGYAILLKVLKKAREDAGLTQTQLAQKIGETQT
jgi:DNA-binding XRE family transcriptional regulator